VGSGNKRVEDHDDEIERLQKELNEAREEIEILQDELGTFSLALAEDCVVILGMTIAFF